MATRYSNSPSGRVSVARRAASWGLWALVAMKADAVPRHNAVTVRIVRLADTQPFTAVCNAAAGCKPISRQPCEYVTQEAPTPYHRGKPPRYKVLTD